MNTQSLTRTIERLERRLERIKMDMHKWDLPPGQVNAHFVTILSEALEIAKKDV